MHTDATVHQSKNNLLGRLHFNQGQEQNISSQQFNLNVLLTKSKLQLSQRLRTANSEPMNRLKPQSSNRFHNWHPTHQYHSRPQGLTYFYTCMTAKWTVIQRLGDTMLIPQGKIILRACMCFIFLFYFIFINWVLHMKTALLHEIRTSRCLSSLRDRASPSKPAPGRLYELPRVK